MNQSTPFDNYASVMYELPDCAVTDILGLGYGVNQPDSFGKFLLIIACQRLAVADVSLLLSSGADTEVRESDGDTPLISAIDISHHNPSAALTIVKALVAAGANLEARGYMGKTPFLKACSRGCLEILQLLVEQGCNVEARDAEGMSGQSMAGIFGGSGEFLDYVRGLRPSGRRI